MVIFILFIMVIWIYIKIRLPTQAHDVDAYAVSPLSGQFISQRPVIYELGNGNDSVKFINLKSDMTGADYVRLVTPDAINQTYNQYMKTLNAARWLININEMIDKFVSRTRPQYQTQFYQEMAQALSGSYEENFRKVIMIESTLESYVYMYLQLEEKHIPASVIDKMGNLGKFKIGKKTVNNIFSQHPEGYPSFEAGCTTGFAKGDYTKNKDVIIFRNFDWMTHGYWNIPLYIFKLEKYNVTTIGYPGMVFSVLSAINSNGVWTNINNASYTLGFSLNFKQPNITTTMFDLLKTSPNANILARKIRDQPFDISCFYFAGDSKGMTAVAHSGVQKKW